MDALTSFIVVIIAITIQFSLYTIKRLQEPFEPNYLIDKHSGNSKTRNSKGGILKPMYSIAVDPIFIKIRITQILFLFIIKTFFLKGEFVLNVRFIFSLRY